MTISIPFSLIIISSFSLPPRWEAVLVLLGGVRVALRPLRRTHPPLPEAHRRKALQVPQLRSQVRAQRPPRPPRPQARLAQEADNFREREADCERDEEGNFRELPPEKSDSERVFTVYDHPANQSVLWLTFQIDEDRPRPPSQNRECEVSFLHLCKTDE